jgi:hypothetical protein
VHRLYANTVSEFPIEPVPSLYPDGTRSELQDEDPATWSANYPRCSYSVSAKTATTTLRGHINKWHLRAYLALALQPGREWPIQVPTVRDGLKLRYSLNELKTFTEKGNTLQHLPLCPANEPTPGHIESDRGTIPPFSLPIFHKFLVNFIVADDQSLNVIEVQEFRNLLLLLREDLKDKDIPRRTKIKKEIIQAWQDYFVVLKQDLAVRSPMFVKIILLINFLNYTQGALGNVSFTTDIWSSDTRKPYLAVTAHWIAGNSEMLSDLNMKSALIAFHCI